MHAELTLRYTPLSGAVVQYNCDDETDTLIGTYRENRIKCAYQCSPRKHPEFDVSWPTVQRAMLMLATHHTLYHERPHA